MPLETIQRNLGKITACRKCKCQSCSDGYENHEHSCTKGPHCVNTTESLLKFVREAQRIAGSAHVEVGEIMRTLDKQCH